MKAAQSPYLTNGALFYPLQSYSANILKALYMCYEFAHPCKDTLINRINLLGGNRYFMVCIGDLNYLYSRDVETIDYIRALLFVEHMVLHIIPEEEMVGLILFEETLGFQKFHGNRELFDTFMRQYKVK